MPPAQPKRQHSHARVRLRRILFLVGLLAIVTSAWFFRRQQTRISATSPVPANAFEILTAFEQQSAGKYWQPELDAQERLMAVTELWDGIQDSTNKLATALANFSPGELILPSHKRDDAIELPHGIRISAPGSSGRVPETRLAELARGWTLDQCEFRFIRINPDTFYVSIHLTHAPSQTRAILEGEVEIQFAPVVSGAAPTKATSITAPNAFARVDASRLELRTRAGSPPFNEVFSAEIPPPAGSYFIDPLIVWDLDSDGQLEILLPASNSAMRRTDEGKWIRDRLLAHDPGLIFTAILGDFTGNGTTDLLVARFDGLHLFEGTKEGSFLDPPRLTWRAEPRLRYPQAITAGDIDRDGDLDLFLGQYKLPFEKGQMPSPYFDANDGFPSFLLANDGSGEFTDITHRAGLAAKRARRSYSATLIDLDRDADLDLIITSDFAGIDAFENLGITAAGQVQFTDVTEEWFPETAALGMANSFADFDRDGFLDLILIGMNSPTADRLASAGLTRPYDVPDAGRRDALTYGNRLYFGSQRITPGGAGPRFQQRPVGAQVARSGWSWGSAAADLDNDGFPELYIANGHASRASTRDYEPEFWLHDIYVGNSQENSLAETYFRQKLKSAIAAGHSYGGHERNRLYLNFGGTNFVEAAHLFGLAMPEDSRNVAAVDLDRDGRLDLIVTTFEHHPVPRQTIRIYRNELDQVGHHLRISVADPLRTGSVAQLVTRENNATRTNAIAIVSGESYRTQLPPELHLGLGAAIHAEILGATNLFIMAEPGKGLRQ